MVQLTVSAVHAGGLRIENSAGQTGWLRMLPTTPQLLTKYNNKDGQGHMLMNDVSQLTGRTGKLRCHD